MFVSIYMSILQKIRDILKTDLLAFIVTDKSVETKVPSLPDEPGKDVSKIYYRGAWKEEGEAKWAFFEEKISNDYSTVKLNAEVIVPKDIATETPLLVADGRHDKIDREQTLEEKKTDVPSEEKNRKEVVSITEMGRTRSRYQTETDYSNVKLNAEVIVSKDIATETPLFVPDSQDKIDREQTVEEKKTDVPSEEKNIEEVVSITEMGRTRSRYQTEDDSAISGLIDQREVTGKKNKIKVFFAEDNRSFQIIIQKLLEKTEDMELLDWATDGRDAVEKIKKLDIAPDVILMDIAMPRLDGISAVKEILAFNNSLKIVMLTAFGDKLHVQNAFDAGAIGFLRKDAGLPLIKEAIKQAARGGRPVHKEVAHYLKEEMN